MNNSTNSNVPVVAGAGNAVAPQNLTSGLSMAGAANGTNLALASAAAAEVLGQMQVAKAFPRNVVQVLNNVQMACDRPSLAEVSAYTYSKGGQEITGASVHLMKAIAALWGNIKSGYVIVESNALQTKCEAYATDLETNYTERVPFVVRHIRHTRKGDYPLTDDREIYELIANNAARRERKCLEAVIPRDVVDEALERCQKTMLASVGEITEERLNRFVDAFKAIGVDKEELEDFIQRPIASIAPAQFVRLGTIYKSIRNGVANKEDFFKGLHERKVGASAASAEAVKTEGDGGNAEAKRASAPSGKKGGKKTVEDALSAVEQGASDSAGSGKADGDLDVADVM